MPSRTTPVIPGSRTSSGLTIIEHVEVPITVTNVAGLVDARAGHRHPRVDVADGDGDAPR